MQRNKGGCCGEAKRLKTEHENLKKLFDIALRALKQYQLEANSLVADDAVDRMRLIDPTTVDSVEFK